MSAKASLYELPIKIYYRKLPSLLGNGIDWPLIDIGLGHKGASVSPKLLALVDSGASSSVLDPEIAEYLGFDLSKLPKQTGGTSASGSYSFWILPEPVSLNIYGEVYTVNFTVIDAPNQMWGCILGHDSIFRLSKILFNTPKKYMEIHFRSDIN